MAPRHAPLWAALTALTLATSGCGTPPWQTATASPSLSASTSASAVTKPRAIAAAARQDGLTATEAAGLTALPGRGVRGEVDGQAYWLGNPRLLAELGVLQGDPAAPRG